MDYIVTAKTTPVTFAPASLAEEVVQNVRVILGTRVGDVPLQRGLGVSWEHIDQPMPVARMLLMGQVVQAIRKWEPRAQVRAVDFPGTALDAMEGILPCRVTISVEEAEEAAFATRAQAAPSTAEVEYPSTDSEALAVAQQARQLAARAVNAATQSLAGLHELETTDYSAIYETGEEN